MLRTLCHTDYRPITMSPCNLLCAPFPSPQPPSGLSPALWFPGLCPPACSHRLHHIQAPPLRCVGLCAGSTGCSPLPGWVLSRHAASCMESCSQLLHTSTFLLEFFFFSFFPSSLFFFPLPFLFSALAVWSSHWGIANSVPFVCCPAAARRGGLGFAGGVDLGFAWKFGICMAVWDLLAPRGVPHPALLGAAMCWWA